MMNREISTNQAQRGTTWFMVVILAPLLLLSGCGTMSTPLADSDTQQTEKKHKILQTASGQMIPETALIEQLLQARVIYLGEKHDNPHHHNLQKRVVETLIAAGKQPAIGFEFFSQDQTGWLMNYSVGKPSSFVMHGHKKPEPGEYLRKQLGWKTRPDWPFYFPLIKLARQHHLAVFGADLATGTRVRLTRNDLETLSALEKSQLSPTNFHHKDYQQLMFKQLASSHCNMASKSLLERLYTTWIARNDAMATAINLMLPATESDPVIMILGAGHTRHNMGVYERVASLNPGIRQINLAFQETQQPMPPLTSYLETVHAGQTTFAAEHAYYWFTPPVEDDHNRDPCAKMRRHTLPKKNQPIAIHQKNR